MSYRVTLAVFGALALPLVAQVPVACVGQLVPLKPVSLFCQGAAPLCVSEANGVRGHWVWGCPAASSAVPGSGTGVDPGVLDSIAHPSSPHIMTPIEAAMEVERLRQLRLQNQQTEQQLKMAPQATSALSDSRPEQDMTSALRAAYGCGVLNGMLRAMDAMGNRDGANGIREALKQTECEQIVASVDNRPVERIHQPDVAEPLASQNILQASACVPEGTGQPLDNDGIVDLVKGSGLKEDTIAWVIVSRPGNYLVSEDALNKLKAAGVPQSAILAIIEKTRCYPPRRRGPGI